ncbi:MAG: YbjP/YqhG family protein [Prevotella sp.]|nr:YbjP/YqhG family protein [Prevotella sp.]
MKKKERMNLLHIGTRKQKLSMFMSKMLFAGCLALVMVCSGCTNKQNDTKAENSSDTIASTNKDVKMDEQTMRQTVEESVKSIYDEVARKYNNYDESIDLDAKFCSKDWNETVAAVTKKDEGSDEIGFFEADYWIMAQDVEKLRIDNVVVQSVDPENARAEVVIDLHNLNETTKVKLDMVQEDGAWKIDDFTDLSYDTDWKKNMKEYLVK